MSNVTFTTASGNKVELTNGAGVKLAINNQPHHGGVELIDHPQHGTCVKTYVGNTLVPVPADMLDATRALFSEAAADCKARTQYAIDNHADHARIVRAMEG